MKKSFLMLSLIAIVLFSCKKDKPASPSTPAKYSISSSDVGAINTNYIVVNDSTNLTGFSLGNAAESQTWDYSALGNDWVDTMKFLDPASTPAASSFPSSNLAMMPEPTQEIYSYIKKSDASIEVIGLYANQNGTIMSASYTDNQTILKFPMYFGTSFTDAGAVDIIAQSGSNWFKVEMRTNYTSQVDASGKITTPAFSGLDCIRDKRTEITTQTMYFGFSQTGPWTQYGNPTNDTTYSYNFYSKGKGYTVAEIRVNNFTSNTITEIQYLK